MNQQPQNDKQEMQGAFNLGTFLLNGHATCLTPFIRTDMGKEAISFNGLAAFFIILLYGGLTNSYPMFIFLCVWMLAVLRQRIKQFQNWKNGAVIHSRYNSFSWLAYKLFPRIKDDDAPRLRGEHEEDVALEESGVAAGRLSRFRDCLPLTDAGPRRLSDVGSEFGKHLPLGAVGRARHRQTVEE